MHEIIFHCIWYGTHVQFFCFIHFSKLRPLSVIVVLQVALAHILSKSLLFADPNDDFSDRVRHVLSAERLIGGRTVQE